MARVRFRPPPVEPTPELIWLLRAAFSEVFADPLDVGRESATRALAHQLGLAAVIGARLRSGAELIGVPEILATDFRKAHARCAIRAAILERTARDIAGTAAGKSVPLVFLKGFALFLAGRDRAGARAIGDLDLLAPEADAGVLHSELRSTGYRAEGEIANEHHLATLVSPEGTSIDLHFCLRGMALEGTTWATWNDLHNHEALVPAEGYPGDCALPAPGFQAAHLLVHGLAHHIWRPHTYPLLQLVGDLQELLPDDDSWERFLDSFRPILLRSVHAPELEAMRSLVRGLRSGRVPRLAARSSDDTAILLRHILGGYLDQTYGLRLRRRHALGRLADAARQGRLGHYLARRLRRNR